MKAVRRIVIVVAAVALGAAAGFTISLLRPRRYAEFSGIQDRQRNLVD